MTSYAVTEKARTSVYIDAFNLYYGAVKGTPYKWLDLSQMCAHLLPGHNITAIKYFTARVVARQNDPDQPLRQQIYIRAIETLPNVTVIYGHFLNTRRRLPLVNQSHSSPSFVEVVHTEEKGSDVNLASHLLYHIFRTLFALKTRITTHILPPI
jgi:hypothetical protein